VVLEEVLLEEPALVAFAFGLLPGSEALVGSTTVGAAARTLSAF